MFGRRIHLCGLFAVLLALLAQLGGGASVPRPDPLGPAVVLCHLDDDSDGTAPQGPSHPFDCPACPLCVTLHTQALALLAHSPILAPPPLLGARRAELPPPSTARPVRHRSPSQPRAPPAIS